MTTFVMADMYRESPIPRPQPVTLFPIRQPHDPPDLITGQILDTQWIDSRLPALWKSTCTCLHGKSCEITPSSSLSAVRPVWLVDVKEKCLIPTPETCTYVALSYVWGSQQTLEATCSNVDRLQRKGSLSGGSTPSIPATIRDAMGVVELLEERYLWVDRLCIVQDDPSQKHTEMAKMSAIYYNASVTILAVQGENADSGLKGFRGVSKPRDLRQSIHSLEDGAMVTQHALSLTQESGSSSSVWERRGWTFQEDLFSRRRLIFNGDLIRWECASAVMYEHIESWSIPARRQPAVFHYQSMFERSLPDLRRLKRIVGNYNKREFTYPEDALKAFAGLAFSLSPAFGGCFVSGLPMALFDIALLWQPEAGISRRIAKNQAKEHCLPSWSWAGWSGSIDIAPSDLELYHVWEDPLNPNRVRRILSWNYHETVNSPGVPINASMIAIREAWLEGRIDETLGGWSKHPSPQHPFKRPELPDLRSPLKYCYKHEMDPQYQFWYPIPLLQPEDRSPGILAQHISCTTRRGWFLLVKHLQAGYCTNEFSLIRGDLARVGTLRVHDELAAVTGPLIEAIELVEIAKGASRQPLVEGHRLKDPAAEDDPKEGAWYEYYYVMWVEWNNGVAYRKGLGRVLANIWEKHRGEPFFLMLG